MRHTKSHDSSKAAKAERRAHRASRHRSGDDHGLEISSLSGPVDPRILRRTLEAFSGVDLGGPWSEVAPMVLPLLKRVRHPFPAEAAPIHLRVPPGVWAGFGIDVGPAWAHVSRDLMIGWGVDEATILGTALENLRQRVLSDPPRVERATFADTAATVIQAQGWASALILAPDRLASILGDAPRMLLAPVRNALIALPEDVEMDLAVAIWDTFAEASPDELDVDPLRWTGSGVVAFLDEPRALVN